MVPDDDDNGNIWLSSGEGIWLLDHSFRFRHFEVKDSSGVPLQQVNRIFFTRPGQLLITNLDYDDYSFMVEATNNDGVWSKNKAVIAITITPPWWKSTVAKSLYLLLFLSVLIGI